MHRRRLITVLALGALFAWAPVPARAEDPAVAVAGQDFRRVIRDAKRRVFPAVVFIKCLREGHESGKRERQEVTGSGVIITADGEFLTNWHVVEKAAEVRCLLSDGRAFHAEVIGTDKDTDIALCRLKRPEGETEVLPHATLGDSTALTEGDFVMAMGAPWGLSRSVSLGIVACTRRYLSGNSEYSLWIQTDASINPGSSGGPLLNSDGDVVGLNTRGTSGGGDLGFAVPSSTISLIVKGLREHGSMPWSWTGLQLQPINDFERDMYFGGDQGVIVAGSDRESPARRSGLQAKDRILSINGQPVTARSQEDLPAIRRTLALLPKGEAAKLVVDRDGEKVDIELTPREKGAVEGKELEFKRWDFTAKAINQFDNPSLYFYRKEGVFIYGTRSPGNAQNSGLQSGDIILRVGKTAIKTLEDLEAAHAEAIEKIDDKHRMVFSVLRAGLLRQVVLDFSRDFERD